MADTATTTGTVKLEGNSEKLVISYKKAEAASNSLNIALTRTGQAWDVQAKAAARAQLANEIASARMENAKQRAADLDRVFGRAGESANKAAAGTGRLAAAAHHGQGPMKAFGSAIHNVSTGQSTMVGAVNQVLSAFGPWGIVIGAAGAALGHFAMQQYEAKKAAEEHTKELKKQKRELEAAARAARVRASNERLDREVEADRKRKLDEEVGGHQEIIRAKQREIAGSKDATEIKLHEITILQQEAEIALSMGDLNEYNNKLHEADLATIRLTVGEEKKRTKEKKEQFHWSAELVNQMRLARAASGMQRDGSDSRDFAAGLEQSRLSGLARGSGRDNIIRDAERATGSRMNDIAAEREAERAFSHDAEIARINEEEAALLQLNSTKESLALTGAERDALSDEREKIMHDARMSRIEAEMQAEEERQKQTKAVLDFGKQATTTVITGIVNVRDARKQAVQAARLQGKTEAEAARAGKIAELDARASQMKGIRDMAILKSIDHAFEAIGAFARYDFVSGGLHLAASAGFAGLAGIAGARGNALQDASFNKQMGGAGGNGAPGSGGGGGSQPRSGPAPIDSEIPGSPTPKPRSSSSGAQSGGTVVYIDRVYGKVDKDFVAQVDEGLKDLSHSKRRKSA